VAALVQLPWSQFLASIAFWAVLLGMKGCFDYWVVILPLRPPVQVLWHRGWLSACKGQITRGGCGPSSARLCEHCSINAIAFHPSVWSALAHAGVLRVLGCK